MFPNSTGEIFVILTRKIMIKIYAEWYVSMRKINKKDYRILITVASQQSDFSATLYFFFTKSFLY